MRQTGCICLKPRAFKVPHLSENYIIGEVPQEMREQTGRKVVGAAFCFIVPTKAKAYAVPVESIRTERFCWMVWVSVQINHHMKPFWAMGRRTLLLICVLNFLVDTKLNSFSMYKENSININLFVCFRVRHQRCIRAALSLKFWMNCCLYKISMVRGSAML